MPELGRLCVPRLSGAKKKNNSQDKIIIIHSTLITNTTYIVHQ